MTAALGAGPGYPIRQSGIEKDGRLAAPAFFRSTATSCCRCSRYLATMPFQPMELCELWEMEDMRLAADERAFTDLRAGRFLAVALRTGRFLAAALRTGRFFAAVFLTGFFVVVSGSLARSRGAGSEAFRGRVVRGARALGGFFASSPIFEAQDSEAPSASPPGLPVAPSPSAGGSVSSIRDS